MSVAWVGVAATVGSALIGAKSAGDAADAQSESAAQSDATQRYQYDLTRSDNAPFRETGLQANNKLAELMNGGQFGRWFSQSDLNADPVYQNGLKFGLDQGTQGINRQAAAGGSMLSGATLKALTRFGNDYGSTKANESYNRFTADKNGEFNKLSTMAGGGQVATNQISAAGGRMADSISQSQQGVGNARASSYLTQGNAWQNALNGGVSAWKNSSQPNSLTSLYDDGYGSGTGPSYNGNYSRM